MRRTSRIALCLAMTVSALMFVLPAGAFAHVSIDPSTASQGGYGVFTLRVPNEDATASTTKIEVQIPQDTPIASVRVQPKLGWTYSIDKKTLTKAISDDDGDITEVVSKITWTGGTIKPGEFEQFVISLGPLPKTDELFFKTLQTYDNGDVVSWIEEPAADGEEPEHPAPELMLSEASGDDHHSTETTTTAAMKKVASDSNEDDDKMDAFTYASMGVGVLALLVALVAVLKRKK